MPKETKHEAFVRLAEVRVGRALEELRLVSQLSGRTYENSPEEAEMVVQHLVGGVENVAQAFGTPISVAIGEDAQIAARTNHLITSRNSDGPVNEMDVAYAIQLIDSDPAAAKAVLKKALTR